MCKFSGVVIISINSVKVVGTLAQCGNILSYRALFMYVLWFHSGIEGGRNHKQVKKSANDQLASSARDETALCTSPQVYVCYIAIFGVRPNSCTTKC